MTLSVRNVRVLVALVLAVAVVLTGVTAVPAAGQAVPADRASAPRVQRIGGASRVETAIAASVEYLDGADEVVLATADDYPDALAAGPLARELGAPILLTPSASLPSVVEEELDRLDPRRVTIVGGPVAVGRAVQDRLKELGHDVRRLGGADRFETARRIARVVGAPDEEVAVALGRGRTRGPGSRTP